MCDAPFPDLLTSLCLPCRPDPLSMNTSVEEMHRTHATMAPIITFKVTGSTTTAFSAYSLQPVIIMIFSPLSQTVEPDNHGCAVVWPAWGRGDGLSSLGQPLAREVPHSLWELGFSGSWGHQRAGLVD